MESIRKGKELKQITPPETPTLREKSKWSNSIYKLNIILSLFRKIVNRKRYARYMQVN